MIFYFNLDYNYKNKARYCESVDIMDDTGSCYDNAIPLFILDPLTTTSKEKTFIQSGRNVSSVLHT